MPRWILFWISFPLSGLIAWLALGPVESPGPALAGGVLAGLGIGAAGAWALRVALGLGSGSLLGTLAAQLVTPPLDGLVHAAIAGLGVGVAQALLHPPLPALAWAVLVFGAWLAGWAVSLAAAIDSEQGFTVFGASGALLFTVIIAVTTTVAARRTSTGAIA